MILRRINVKRLRTLRDFECSIAPGLTLVVGPNEAGKSSLVEAILLGLLGNVASTARSIEECKSWDTEAKPDILLEFDIDDNSYVLHKDFHNRSVELRNKNTGEVWTDRRSVDHMMRDTLGVPTDRLYASTACIGQAEVRDIRHGVKELPAQLELRLTGAGLETSAQEALSWLQKRVRPLKKTGTKPSTYGIIQAREAELVELKRQLADLQEPLGERSEARAQMSELEHRLADLRAVLAASSSALQKAQKHAQARDWRDVARTRFAKLDQRTRSIEELNSKLREVNERLAETESIREGDLGKIRLIQAKTEAKEEEKARIRDRLDKSTRSTALALVRFLPAALIPLGLLLGVGAIVAWIFTREPTYSVIIGIGALVALLVGVTSLLLVRQLVGATAYEAHMQRLDETEQELERLQKDVEATLEEHGVEQVEELSERAEAYQRLLNSKEKLASKLEGLCAGESEEAIAAERERLLADLALAEKVLDDLGPYELDPVGLERLRRTVGLLAEREKSLSEERLQCKLTLESEARGVEDLHQLAERCAAVEDRLSELKRRLEVYELTQDVITEARDGAIEAASGAVESAVGTYMQRITSARYMEVRWNKEELSFELFSAEKEDWIVPGSELSAGTADQLYLAIRLALVGAICGEARPPLIFDDPFVSFDENRKRNAMSLCKELSAELGYQIVFLSCDSSYEPLVDAVVEIHAR